MTEDEIHNLMMMKMGMDDMRAGITERDYTIGELRSEIERHHADFEKIRTALDEYDNAGFGLRIELLPSVMGVIRGVVG